MWKRNTFGIAMAALLAGTAAQQAAAQDYYGGYDQYGYDNNYDNGTYGNGYGYDQYGGQYDGAQYGADPYGGAQYDASVDFDYFYGALAPYGQWQYHPRWGRVWHPSRVGADFRPYYSHGYWSDTVEYGATWVSDYPWGNIAFHYGRWVLDPVAGWLWVPGYVWSPSWVVWRSGGGYLGWFPMPPTNNFLLGIEVYSNSWNNWDRGFGYADWYGPNYGASWTSSLWCFVQTDYFGRRDWHRYAAPRNRIRNIVRNTVNITHYTTVNNYIVNRSVDRGRFDRGNRWDRPVRARDVLHNGTRTRVDAGRRIGERERRNFGGNVNASPRERLQALPNGGRHGPRVGNPRRQQNSAANGRPGGRNQGNAAGPRRQPNRAAPQQRDRAALQQPRGARGNAQRAPNPRQRAGAQQPRQDRANIRQRQQQDNARARQQQRQRAAVQQRQRQQQDNARARQQQRQRAATQQRQRQRAAVQQQQRQRVNRQRQQRQQTQHVRAQRQQQRQQRPRQQQRRQSVARDNGDGNGRRRGR